MKFRILEIKRAHQKKLYRPQYKTFLFWHDISDTDWADTIMCKWEFNDWHPNCLDTMHGAEQCIADYKKYVNDGQEYVKIHDA